MKNNSNNSQRKRERRSHWMLRRSYVVARIAEEYINNPDEYVSTFTVQINGKKRQKCLFGPYFKPPCSPSLRRQGALVASAGDTIHFSGSCYWQHIDIKHFYQKAQFCALVFQVRLQAAFT